MQYEITDVTKKNWQPSWDIDSHEDAKFLIKQISMNADHDNSGRGLRAKVRIKGQGIDVTHTVKTWIEKDHNLWFLFHKMVHPQAKTGICPQCSGHAATQCSWCNGAWDREPKENIVKYINEYY